MVDINVLTQACCAFRNLFLKLVKMVPFRQAITISSICNKVFRTTFLKPDTVGVIPRGGIEWETASLLRLFYGWRTFFWRGTMLLNTEIEGGSFAWGTKCESRRVLELTLERIRLLTEVVIGMMAIYYIQNWRLCYMARHHLLLQSIASGLR